MHVSQRIQPTNQLTTCMPIEFILPNVSPIKYEPWSLTC